MIIHDLARWTLPQIPNHSPAQELAPLEHAPLPANYSGLHQMKVHATLDDRCPVVLLQVISIMQLGNGRAKRADALCIGPRCDRHDRPGRRRWRGCAGGDPFSPSAEYCGSEAAPRLLRDDFCGVALAEERCE